MSLLSRFPAALGTPAVLLGLAAIACEPGVAPVLVKRAQARALAAELRVDLLASAEAEKRAVMAESDEASARAADEAEAATRALGERAAVLSGLLASLSYEPEASLLRTFEHQLAESKRVDAELLALARGNTNEKAWQLAFGPGQAAADDFAARLAEATRLAPPDRAARAESLAASALLSVREVQVLEAPHIRASEDAAMTALEERMARAQTSARASVAALAELLGPLDAVSEALDRFFRTHADVVALSRQNTDVRSLALSLGEKRRLTAACDATLAALQDALARRGQEATR
jgi:hypothetical protein